VTDRESYYNQEALLVKFEAGEQDQTPSTGQCADKNVLGASYKKLHKHLTVHAETLDSSCGGTSSSGSDS